jgi:hypothetical protein
VIVGANPNFHNNRDMKQNPPMIFIFSSHLKCCMKLRLGHNVLLIHKVERADYSEYLLPVTPQLLKLLK